VGAEVPKPSQNYLIKSVHNVVPDLIRDPGDLEEPGSPFTGMTELASGLGLVPKSVTLILRQSLPARPGIMTAGDGGRHQEEEPTAGGEHVTAFNN